MILGQWVVYVLNCRAPLVAVARVAYRYAVIAVAIVWQVFGSDEAWFSIATGMTGEVTTAQRVRTWTSATCVKSPMTGHSHTVTGGGFDVDDVEELVAFEELEIEELDECGAVVAFDIDDEVENACGE